MELADFLAADAKLQAVPPNVAAGLIVDFDYTQMPGGEGQDIFRALSRLHERPDIFWTPYHGGHWVATRAEDIRWIQETWQLFSNTEKFLPKGARAMMPPITFDPPEHSRYRAIFNPHFAKRRVEELHAPMSRAVTIELIEGLRPLGHCEFVSEFSVIAPLRVFWGKVNLPYDKREDFLAWGRLAAGMGTPQQRLDAIATIRKFLDELLEERLANPGNDIFTAISQWRDNPRYRERAELVGMAELIFFGGLDTVVSQIGFAMQRLAERPELQQRLKEDPAIIPAAVDELLRRHGLSNSPKLVMQDIEHKGASLRTGDMIMTVNPLAGVDERAYPDAFTVDFDRGPVEHNSLGHGPHKCVGQHLARMEMRIFLEEWSRRMPTVRICSDKPPVTRAGGVIGVESLHLFWD